MITNDQFPMRQERDALYSGGPDTPPVNVWFGLHPIKDEKASKLAGYDVFKDVEFIRITIPGDKTTVVFQPANDTYRQRFPQTYAAFKSQDVKPINGLRIEEWAPISRSMALNLKAANIDTVEALAAVQDSHVSKLGLGARELREKAKAFLAQAADSAAATRLAAEKEELKRQLEAMQAQINALVATRADNDDGAQRRKKAS